MKIWLGYIYEIGLRGSRIHKARWCKERNSPAGECKSNDGPMNQVYPHSIHEPIADHQRAGDIFLQAKNLVAQG